MKISLFSLVVLMIAAIDNMRNLPSAALFGSSLIFFSVLAALLFLVPTALVAAELSSVYPEKGGVYHWISESFGKKMGMAAIWLQWINTMVWYPSMLSFVAGTFAYLIDPALAENKTYLITFILTVFWSLTWLNLKGIHVSTLINSLCCLIGTMFPLLLLIGLGALWVYQGNPIKINLSWSELIPPLDKGTSYVSLIAIMASFLGMELSSVHVNDVKNPQKTFPKAALLATLFIFLSMTLGSLAIAFVISPDEMQLIAGVMQVFNRFFDAFGLSAFTPYLTALIVIGSIGTMINWLISPAKGLLHAAEYGFLPPLLAKKNKNGVPANILILQALLVSLFCLVFLLEPNINGFYWFLTALSTELYMIMYVLMFLAAIRHRMKKQPSGTFRVPFLPVVACFGLVGSVSTILVSFLPPENVSIGSPLLYFVMISIGNVLTLSPLAFFYLYEKKKRALGEA